MRHTWLIILIFSTAAFAQNSPQQVNNLRLWHSPDRTRIVFDVSANVQHQMFTLADPLRLVVDIENAALNFKLPSLDSSNPHISAIRSGRPDDVRLRFVFDLKKKLLNTDFVLSPNELYGHRLVIDLSESINTSKIAAQSKGKAAGPKPAVERVQDSNRGSLSAVPIAINPDLRRAERNKKLLIAIDAGHGGEDPGALGHKGTREKRLTLAIARKLESIIIRDSRLQAYMVRQGDYYIKLHKRRQMAREAGADLFISIHADAFRKKSARGFSVFALSQSGATSAMARALAAKENASDLIGGVSLADKDEVLAKVLVDLSMTNTISESVNFGGRVLKELSGVGKLHSKRVEQANFAVLNSADIPSVLVETGFVTNPNEEINLRSDAYQTKVAQAIHRAINEYYQQTPYRSNAIVAAPIAPKSSRASTGLSTYTSLVKPKNRGNKKYSKSVRAKSYHKVVRGDSLSKIAYRYGTSVGELKRLNKLKRDTVVLGQRLKIPGDKNRITVTKSTPKPLYYTVKPGDSLSKLSQRFNVTIRSLKANNKIRKDAVYIGQKLKIPGGVAQPNTHQKKALTHTVKRGDTLSEIAEKYGSSVSKIKRMNALRSSTVMLGQRLKIPQ